VSDGERKRVLVIDDDDDVRHVVVEILAEEGYAVAAFSNGEEALTWLATADPLPGLILLDLMMPVMDGWEFRRRQAAHARWAGIPTLILTADGNSRTKASLLGVAGALPKPLTIEALLTQVARHC
jgi:CheY-like chemotaxis protein